MKTEIEIERDFYAMLKASELGKAVKGGLYRSMMRPANSTAEDIVLKLLSGTDGQFQEGVVILNIYVPAVSRADGSQVPDQSRIGTLQRLYLDFIETADMTDYWIESDSTPQTILNEEISQYLIYCRIHYKRISNE